MVDATATEYFGSVKEHDKSITSRLPSDREGNIEAVEFRGQQCRGGWRLSFRLGVLSFKESRLGANKGIARWRHRCSVPGFEPFGRGGVDWLDSLQSSDEEFHTTPPRQDATDAIEAVAGGGERKVQWNLCAGRP